MTDRQLFETTLPDWSWGEMEKWAGEDVVALVDRAVCEVVPSDAEQITQETLHLVTEAITYSVLGRMREAGVTPRRRSRADLRAL